ncbi:hypothetical protein CU098_011302, partial [Rhizopus stolonifer]
MYRYKHHIKTAADNYALLQAGCYKSSARCFVGEVYFYFEHTYCNERRFLAVVNVMKDHKFGEYLIPHVTKDPHRKHFAVMDATDVLHCVALFQYSNNQYNFRASPDE